MVKVIQGDYIVREDHVSIITEPELLLKEVKSTLDCLIRTQIKTLVHANSRALEHFMPKTSGEDLGHVFLAYLMRY